MNTPLNILVTLNEAYIPCLNVMLTSLLSSNPGSDFHVWLLHTQVRENALADTRRILAGRGELTAVQADPRGLEGAPTTAYSPRAICPKRSSAHSISTPTSSSTVRSMRCTICPWAMRSSPRPRTSRGSCRR